MESSPKFKGPRYPVFSHRSLYDRVLSGTHSKVLDAREFLGQFWEGCSGTAQDELGGGCGRQEVGCGRHSEGYRGHQRLMPGQEGDNVPLCSLESPPGKDSIPQPNLPKPRTSAAKGWRYLR